MKVLVTLMLLSFSLSAQTVEAVVNVGDWTPRLTFHSIAAVFGTELANGTCVADSIPLPMESLCGVSVNLTRRFPPGSSIFYPTGGTEHAIAPLYYVSPTQINFQVPGSQWDDLLSAGPDVTTELCVGSSCVDVPGLSVLPEPVILEYGDSLPVITHTDGSLISAENPVDWGEPLVAYAIGLGFGMLSGGPEDGEETPLDRLFSIPIDVYQVTGIVGPHVLSEIFVRPLFAGLAPGFVGLSQINFVPRCVDAVEAEPQIQFVSRFFEWNNPNSRSQIHRLPMSDAAQAAWERDCR